MAATAIVNLNYPKVRCPQEKILKIVRTDTTAFVAGWLPKDAIISGLYVIGSAVSNAATTATISVGTTATSNELLASYDVKTAATGEGYNIAGAAAVGSAMMTKLTTDTPLYAIYAESGTASTAGGPWYVKVEYFVTGAGEDAQM